MAFARPLSSEPKMTMKPTDFRYDHGTREGQLRWIG